MKIYLFYRCESLAISVKFSIIVRTVNTGSFFNRQECVFSCVKDSVIKVAFVTTHDNEQVKACDNWARVALHIRDDDLKFEISEIRNIQNH